MGQRARSSRWALWAAVSALLLKAAVPVLAATAAYLQGVPVAAVCHVYGVSMPPSAHAEHHREGAEPSGEPQHHEPAPHSSSAHTGDHCALTSLAAMAVPAVVTVSAALAPAATPLRDPYGTAASQRDACASWAAQLQPAADLGLRIRRRLCVRAGVRTVVRHPPSRWVACKLRAAAWGLA